MLFDYSLESGLEVFMSSMGVAVADVNGDGELDVYVTNDSGSGNRLFLGQGDGTFLDGTAGSGTGVFRGLLGGGVLRLRQRWASGSVLGVQLETTTC